MYYHSRPTGLAGIAVLAVGLSVAAQEPTFRSGSRVVPSYVTVVDANNRLVTDLTGEDFEVFDNGKTQDITIFDNEVRPFTAVVMLDTSVSMTDRLKDLYAGAEQFFLRLLPQDKAAVGAFNDKIEFASGFSNDKNTSRRRLEASRLRQPDATLRRCVRQPQRAQGRGRAEGDSAASPMAPISAAARDPERRWSVRATKK